jgi:outer membrane protein OmpA-like peptidoglycan-associated protein
MDLSGYMYDQNKKPLANIKFTIFNQKNPLDKKEITTGGNGKFEFKNLDAEKNYYFSTDENDPKLNGVEKIFIADSRGRIFKVLNKDAKGAFVYKILPADKTILGQFVVDDPWLQVLELKNKKQKESLTIVENIYYGLNDYKFDQAGRIILDKVIQILKDNPNLNIELSSHTDSRAGDAYNLKLSQKRAQYAVDYIISRGVDKKRLKAIGFGETKLLNRCANGVECSEDEHKINRRTEFKIVDTKQASSIK